MPYRRNWRGGPKGRKFGPRRYFSKRSGSARRGNYQPTHRYALRRGYARNVAATPRLNRNELELKVACLWTGTLAPVQGATVTNYISTAFTPFATEAGLWKTQKFLALRSLFDSFRVTYMKVTLTPRGNVLDSHLDNMPPIAADGGDLNNVNNYNVMYTTAIDRDAGGQHPANMAVMTGYSSLERHRLTEVATRNYTFKYSPDQWFNANTTTPPDPLASPQIQGGFAATVLVYGENFPEPAGSITNSFYFDVQVEYGVVFRGPTLTVKGITTDGDVILAGPSSTPVPPAPTVPVPEVKIPSYEPAVPVS